ncbi:hypothetical protein BC826DRAFT_1179576 [Russula brevipes]|nr:hypothetical protein BC826DRAFT_1179576 [Russula brevipes]
MKAKPLARILRDVRSAKRSGQVEKEKIKTIKGEGEGEGGGGEGKIRVKARRGRASGARSGRPDLKVLRGGGRCVVSRRQGGSGVIIEGAGDVADSLLTHILSVANLQDFGPNGVKNEGERPGVVVALSNLGSPQYTYNKQRSSILDLAVDSSRHHPRVVSQSHPKLKPSLQHPAKPIRSRAGSAPGKHQHGATSSSIEPPVSVTLGGEMGSGSEEPGGGAWGGSQTRPRGGGGGVRRNSGRDGAGPSSSLRTRAGARARARGRRGASLALFSASLKLPEDGGRTHGLLSTCRGARASSSTAGGIGHSAAHILRRGIDLASRRTRRNGRCTTKYSGKEGSRQKLSMSISVRATRTTVEVSDGGATEGVTPIRVMGDRPGARNVLGMTSVVRWNSCTFWDEARSKAMGGRDHGAGVVGQGLLHGFCLLRSGTSSIPETCWGRFDGCSSRRPGFAVGSSGDQLGGPLSIRSGDVHGET